MIILSLLLHSFAWCRLARIELVLTLPRGLFRLSRLLLQQNALLLLRFAAFLVVPLLAQASALFLDLSSALAHHSVVEHTALQHGLLNLVEAQLQARPDFLG